MAPQSSEQQQSWKMQEVAQYELQSAKSKEEFTLGHTTVEDTQ